MYLSEPKVPPLSLSHTHSHNLLLQKGSNYKHQLLMHCVVCLCVCVCVRESLRLRKLEHYSKIFFILQSAQNSPTITFKCEVYLFKRTISVHWMVGYQRSGSRLHLINTNSFQSLLHHSSSSDESLNFALPF